jgi:hypothetical protein
MKGAAQRWIVATLVGLVVAAGQVWAEVTDADRLFLNFTRETATVPKGQLRLEVRGVTGEASSDPTLNAAGFELQQKDADQLDYGNINLLATYGITEGVEAGLMIQGLFQGLSFPSAPTENTAGVGDFLMYGKFQRNVYEHLNMGAGLELSMPNGSDSKGLGAGDFGANPFISGRYQDGPWGVGAHVGYYLYGGDTPNVFNCSLEGFLRASPAWGFRVEWSQRVFTQGGNHIWESYVAPGIDVNVIDNLTVRPVGIAGTTSDSLNWGIGAGIAYTFQLTE